MGRESHLPNTTTVHYEEATKQTSANLLFHRQHERDPMRRNDSVCFRGGPPGLYYCQTVLQPIYLTHSIYINQSIGWTVAVAPYYSSFFTL